jgi:hypothetical protein
VKEIIDDVLETPILQEFGGPVLFEFFGVLVDGPILNFGQNMRVDLSALILKSDQEDTVSKVFRVLHQSLYNFVLVGLLVNTARFEEKLPELVAFSYLDIRLRYFEF